MYVLEGICPVSSGQGLTGQKQNFVRLFDQDSGRCNMKYRIAIWAAVGFLVASGWAVYFFLKNKDLPDSSRMAFG